MVEKNFIKLVASNIPSVVIGSNGYKIRVYELNSDGPTLINEMKRKE
jgi:hypothetical protein